MYEHSGHVFILLRRIVESNIKVKNIYINKLSLHKYGYLNSKSSRVFSNLNEIKWKVNYYRKSGKMNESVSIKIIVIMCVYAGN